MGKELKEIPFDQGSVSTILTTVCALLMFLTFFSYSFYHLFTPRASLIEAQNALGYVLALPAEETGEGDVAFQPFENKDILKHVFSSIEDVVTYREFTLKDYAPLLGHFEPKEAEIPYLEVRLAHHHHVHEETFRADMEGLVPGVKVYTRQEFFGKWTAHLIHIAQAGRFLAVLMGVALMVSITVLLGNCFKIHRDTIQTLRFLGASQAYVTGKFRRFFRSRFLLGSVLGLLLAFVFFVPVAFVLDPTLTFNIMAVKALFQALSLGLGGYVVLFFLLHFTLFIHGKRLV
jgi:hypothetical protein